MKTCHLNHLDPIYLLTKDHMILFLMPTRGWCELFSHLNPPMGTGVKQQPNLNQIITHDGQFFSLADQGNTGLKVFFASLPGRSA